MTERIRKPALAPPPIRPAVPLEADPTAFLENHYQHVWETRMHDLPFVNAALAVQAVGFQRYEGDWLGVMVTPWFLNLFLLSGGGQLWGDIPAGERRYLNLPCGTLQFIADDDPDLGPYQYCPLIAPVSSIPDMATALKAAQDAMVAIFIAPGTKEETVSPSDKSKKPDDEIVHPGRRGFFRRLAGRKQRP